MCSIEKGINMNNHGHKEYNLTTVNGKRKIFQARLKKTIQGRIFNKWSKRERFGSWLWTWRFKNET